MKKVGRFSLFELQGDSSVIDKASQKTFVGGGSGSSTDPYTQEELDSMMYSGHWNGGWVYGMGWITPQVYIYPNRYNYSGSYHPEHGGGSFWPGGGWPGSGGNAGSYNPNHNNYYHGHNGYWGHYGYHSYGGGGVWGGSGDGGYGKDWNFIKVDDGECIVGSIVNAGKMLGVNLKESGITSDLSDYKNDNINRYFVSDEKLEDILDDYFNVKVSEKVGDITKHVVAGKPVYIRLLRGQDTVGDVDYLQVHDVIITNVNNSTNGYFEYYDPVEGTVGKLTEADLRSGKVIKNYYLLDHK